MEIWAHRGARLDRPENTLAAFEAAVHAGADGIELDVHLSADGALVVRHDPDLPLPRGPRVRLEHLTLAQIQGVNVGSRKHGFHAVPTLDEVYELLKPTSVTVNIEVKVGRAPYVGIVDKVLAAQRDARMPGRVVYSSFHHQCLVEILAASPDAEVAPLLRDSLVTPWTYVLSLGARAVHPQYKTLMVDGVLDGYRDAGIAVRPWTVGQPALWRTLTQEGVDAILTDDPRAAVAVRNSVAKGGGVDAG
jgi:glycerophosphoryl diester phosphodiesterase